MSPLMRQLPRSLTRRRGHATALREMMDHRIILAWVYTTLIVVRQDLREGDGVPLSASGHRCRHSDEEVLIACLDGDVGGRDVRIGVGQVQVIPSAELAHLRARCDTKCRLFVLASDDQAVRQRTPLKKRRSICAKCPCSARRWLQQWGGGGRMSILIGRCARKTQPPRSQSPNPPRSRISVRTLKNPNANRGAG